MKIDGNKRYFDLPAIQEDVLRSYFYNLHSAQAKSRSVILNLHIIYSILIGVILTIAFSALYGSEQRQLTLLEIARETRNEAQEIAACVPNVFAGTHDLTINGVTK